MINLRFDESSKGLKTEVEIIIKKLDVDLSNIVITYEEILKRTETETTFKIGYKMAATKETATKETATKETATKETATSKQTIAMIYEYVKSRRDDIIETNNYAADCYDESSVYINLGDIK